MNLPCTKCGESEPKAEFHYRDGVYKASECKCCLRIRAALYYHKNKEKEFMRIKAKIKKNAITKNHAMFIGNWICGR